MPNYKQLAWGIRRDDGAHIPPDESNRDWQTYLEWLNAGNTPEPPDEPSPPTEG